MRNLPPLSSSAALRACFYGFSLRDAGLATCTANKGGHHRGFRRRKRPYGSWLTARLGVNLVSSNTATNTTFFRLIVLLVLFISLAALCASLTRLIQKLNEGVSETQTDADNLMCVTGLRRPSPYLRQSLRELGALDASVLNSQSDESRKRRIILK